MKVTDLIDILDDAIDEFGDVDVYIFDAIKGGQAKEALFGAGFCEETQKLVLLNESDYTYTCQQNGLISDKSHLKLVH